MFTRLNAIILMFAVLACPMGCGVGVCHDADCRLNESREVKCCEHCPQKIGGDSELPDENDDLPDRCPNQSTCQGICGGAVLEKTCELNEHSRIFEFAVESVNTVENLSGERLAHQVGNQSFRGNHGRFLRTLHDSLIC